MVYAQNDQPVKCIVSVQKILAVVNVRIEFVKVFVIIVDSVQFVWVDHIVHATAAIGANSVNGIHAIITV